jgi:hypothetical protein
MPSTGNESLCLARSEESLEAGMSTVGRIGGQSESMKLDVADTAALWSTMPRLWSRIGCWI